MKLWIRDKIWKWLGIGDIVDSIDKHLASIMERVKDLEDSSKKRVASFARLRDEVTEWEKLTSHQGEAMVSLGEAVSNRKKDIDTLTEQVKSIELSFEGAGESIALVNENIEKTLIKSETIKADIKELVEKFNKYSYKKDKNEAAIYDLRESLDIRRNEIDSLIERFQNLDNEEVIRDLHLRIVELEDKK